MPEEVTAVADKENEKPSKTPKKVKTFLNKVIIRKLPPNMSSSEFLESIQPLPEYTDFYFVNADWSLGVEATSRAYIEFKRQEDIFIFKDKFDGYVFIDKTGAEYCAIVEYAPFQGLTKSRARKKDKNSGTIESEQHFLNFLDMLKKAEESENQKTDLKVEYSYQIKDDKKITSTPLLEFIAASKEEKREAKKKKIEERKKNREDEKQKKKQQVAKSIPEPIKESKEEIVYEDGVVVRTVPSRLGRNDKSSRKEPKVESKTQSQSQKNNNEKERREKREKERDSRKKAQASKTKELKAESVTEKKTELDKTSSEEKPSQPQKREVKRYSELRKARQEKTTDPKDAESNENPKAPETEQSENNEDSRKESEAKEDVVEEEDERWKKIKELREKRAMRKSESAKKSEPPPTVTDELDNDETEDYEERRASMTDDDPRWKKILELREKRARERDERAQRQIRNKDRPSMQIYRPKRVDSKTENATKSSDETSETGRKRSDSCKKSKADRKMRKNSKDELYRKKKNSKTNSEDGNTQADKTIDASEMNCDYTAAEELSNTFENNEKNVAEGHADKEVSSPTENIEKNEN